MTLPFRRHGRPRGAARLALAGDIPDTYDATAIEFSGASDAGLPSDAIYGPALASPDDAVTVTPEWWRP